MIIGCYIHGEYQSTLQNHKSGYGCQKCNTLLKSKRYSLSTQQNILDFRKIHGDTYNYPFPTKKARDLFEIECKKHGLFKCTPNHHKRGIGCPSCAKDSRIKSFENNLKDFIKVHKNKDNTPMYVYPMSTTTKNQKIKIICKIHGPFWQTPDRHKAGTSCPFCAKALKGWSKTAWEKQAKFSKKFDSFKIYIIFCFNSTESFIKIGRTFNTVKERFRQKESMPYKYFLLKEFVFKSAKDAFDNENYLHSKFKDFRYTPLIRFPGDTECFTFHMEL